jgi:hypothetical protein
MPIIPMPPLDKLLLQYEARVRFERRTDRDFSRTDLDNRSDVLTRIRIGGEYKFDAKTRVFAQYQYAHDWIWTPQLNFSTENSDLYQGFVERKFSDGTVTLGRQLINIGNQRLIGGTDWANVARSFDGVRYKSTAVDAFAAAIGVSSPRPRFARIAGVYLPRGAQSFGLIFKHDEVGAADVDVFTLNWLGSGQAGAVRWNAEAAVQLGDNLGRDHFAWALHADGGISSGRAYFYAVADVASGGTGSRSRTFDNLYPTNHNKYGILDMQGWRNVIHFAVGVDYLANPATTLRSSLHTFRLFDNKDAWYGAGGGPNRRPGGTFVDPTGSSGSHVGSELDFEVIHKLNATTTINGGFGIFFPGEFIDSFIASVRPQHWGFLLIATKY